MECVRKRVNVNMLTPKPLWLPCGNFARKSDATRARLLAPGRALRGPPCAAVLAPCMRQPARAQFSHARALFSTAMLAIVCRLQQPRDVVSIPVSVSLPKPLPPPCTCSCCCPVLSLSQCTAPRAHTSCARHLAGSSTSCGRQTWYADGMMGMSTDMSELPT